MKKIVVVGAGTMGAGIAQVAAEAGYDVALGDISDEFVQQQAGRGHTPGAFDLALRPAWRFVRAYFLRLGFLGITDVHERMEFATRRADRRVPNPSRRGRAGRPVPAVGRRRLSTRRSPHRGASGQGR